MTINKRAKGNRAEREVLHILKSHFGSSPWERKPMGIPGPDLLTPPSFPYAVEIKHHKSISFKHLFKPTSLLLSFFNQSLSQASSLNKQPLLIIKIEGIWMVIDSLPNSHYSKWSLLNDWLSTYPSLPNKQAVSNAVTLSKEK